MTSRTPYKPEGWPTAEDLVFLAIMSSQEVKQDEPEIEMALAVFGGLVHQSYFEAPGADSRQPASRRRLSQSLGSGAG